MDTYERAFSLNQLANEHAIKMRYSKAILCYKQSLSLYIALAKCNPEGYGLAIAHIFSNLAIIYLNLEQVERCDEFHQNALKMHRALSKANPTKYAIELIHCLVDGVRYLNQHPFTLYEAEIAVAKIKHIEESDKLLGVIHKLHAPAIEN